MKADEERLPPYTGNEVVQWRSPLSITDADSNSVLLFMFDAYREDMSLASYQVGRWDPASKQFRGFHEDVAIDRVYRFLVVRP